MDINDIRLLYLENKFNCCDSIEQYYFNVYIAKKSNITKRN